MDKDPTEQRPDITAREYLSGLKTDTLSVARDKDHRGFSRSITWHLKYQRIDIQDCKEGL